MKPVHSSGKNDALRIVFVACNRNPGRFREDPSFVYRCENLAAALEAAGHSVSLTHLTDFPLRRLPDAAVFHRPRMTIRLRAMLLMMRRFGKIVVADIDDLICDPGMAGWNPGVMNGQVAPESIRRLYASHRNALGRFARITVSTEPLAREVRTRFPNASVCVLPNAVFREWREGAESFRPEVGRVTYFCGTRSHDRDFAVAEPGIEAFLAANPAARMEVTGPLRHSLRAREGQVIQRTKVPFAEYAPLFRGAWVNLAPLEDTPFTRCKSALKVLEAGFWGVPTICSPNPDMERYAEAGALTVRTGADWSAPLERLMDPGVYGAVAEGLRERVLALADVDAAAERFLGFIARPGAAR